MIAYIELSTNFQQETRNNMHSNLKNTVLKNEWRGDCSDNLAKLS